MFVAICHWNSLLIKKGEDYYDNEESNDALLFNDNVGII